MKCIAVLVVCLFGACASTEASNKPNEKIVEKTSAIVPPSQENALGTARREDEKAISRSESNDTALDTSTEDAERYVREGLAENRPIPNGITPKGVTIAKTGTVVLGSVSKDEIRKRIARVKKELGACHSKSLERSPELEGVVKVKFVIANTGRVASAEVRGMDIETQRCVGEIFEALEFPKPTGGGIVIVNYPINFTTKR